MATSVKDLTRIAHDWTARFLERHLPQVCGDDWWKKCVRWKLSVPQERLLDERKTQKLTDLDLAALLRVLEKNWRELSMSLGLPRDGRTLVNEVRNIRNRYAHEGLAGTLLEDQQRDADTLARYLALIETDDSVVLQAKALRDDIARRVLSGDSHADSTEGELDDIEPSTEAVDEELEDLADAGSNTDQGIPIGSLGARGLALKGIREALEKATYVGIDFGTSTTVVSVMRLTGQPEQLEAVPISIKQWRDDGAEITDHLLPTCLAWDGEKLLVGRGAANLQAEHDEGRNVWSSFKMKLGIDLGPQYPNTSLPEGKGPAAIERPQDAARVFFSYIREAVEDYAQSERLPPRIYYAVSVPAAFEANQRQDLLNALSEAGMAIEEAAFIDEPNAAFLSYLAAMERGTTGAPFLGSLSESSKTVLVFDFGAGTCDISVLEVKLDNDKLSSRNLAISKFMALGGDDIDRAIAREVLLPQLCEQRPPTDLFTIGELENAVLPKLKPAAEALKIQCSKMAEQSGARTIDDLKAKHAPVVGTRVPPFKLRGRTWELPEPRLSLSEFASVLGPFLADPSFDDDEAREAVPSVLEPIQSALDKAGLAYDDLNMVLFIGGSCENPLVRTTIEEHAGRFVDCVTPSDLRSHVSQGAAIHSLFTHGLGWDLVRPITSEDLFVITRNGGLERILPAGTPVPSPDIAVTELLVDSERQPRIELPFCVSDRNKLLGIVSVRPPKKPGYFKKGEVVRLSCSINREKLLKVRIRIGNQSLLARFLNPLANTELTSDTRQFLEARQALNEAILAGHGRPTVAAVFTYASAAEASGRWREAAEMYEAVERLDPKRDLANKIDYDYWMAGDYRKAAIWAEKAHERHPTGVTAANLAISRKQSGDLAGFESLMEEALELDDTSNAVLTQYGHHLLDKGDPRGLPLIEKAFAQLSDQLNDAGALPQAETYHLRRAARTLGRTEILGRLKEPASEKGESGTVLNEKFLLVGQPAGRLMKQGH